MSRFEIKSSGFYGPVDLLLQMIEARKLPINQISLAEIAGEYIAFVKEHEESLENITYFVNTVATLILIKSKSLLPDLEYTEGEKEDIAELEMRLQLLKTFQGTAEYITDAFGNRYYRAYFARPRKIEPRFRPDKNIQKKIIEDLILEVLENQTISAPKFNERKITLTIKIEEVIKRLEDRIRSAMGDSFLGFVENITSEMTDPYERKNYKVVSFLALLELVRGGVASVEQSGHMEDITIKLSKENV